MELITAAVNDAVATVTLNDPERLNAMSVAMGREFSTLFKTIGKDKKIRAVVLTGAGRAFSSGGNLDMICGLIGKPKAGVATKLKAFYKLFLCVRDIPQPVIAAINGPAIGAGFCLAMACDLKYAAANAKMGANFSRIGLAPGMAGTYLMSRLAGPVHAAEILLTGKTFGAPQAERYGLINAILPDGELLTHATDVARDIASNAPLAVAKIKFGLQDAQNKTLAAMFDYDAKSQALCLNSQDIKEGINAIKEKRAPVFQGR